MSQCGWRLRWRRGDDGARGMSRSAGATAGKLRMCKTTCMQHRCVTASTPTPATPKFPKASALFWCAVHGARRTRSFGGAFSRTASLPTPSASVLKSKAAAAECSVHCCSPLRLSCSDAPEAEETPPVAAVTASVCVCVAACARARAKVHVCMHASMRPSQSRCEYALSSVGGVGCNDRRVGLRE